MRTDKNGRTHNWKCNFPVSPHFEYRCHIAKDHPSRSRVADAGFSSGETAPTNLFSDRLEILKSRPTCWKSKPSCLKSKPPFLKSRPHCRRSRSSSASSISERLVMISGRVISISSRPYLDSGWVVLISSRM